VIVLGFNVPSDTYVIGHFRDESFQAIDCTGTDNQIENTQNTE